MHGDVSAGQPLRLRAIDSGQPTGLMKHSESAEIYLHHVAESFAADGVSELDVN